MLPDPVVHGFWGFRLNSNYEASALPSELQLRVVFFSGGSRQNLFPCLLTFVGRTGLLWVYDWVSISFPPQGRSELLEAAHCFWLMALSIIFRSNVFMCGCMCEGAMAFDPLELKL